jgi:hypothetical protein
MRWTEQIKINKEQIVKWNEQIKINHMLTDEIEELHKRLLRLESTMVPR